jgi:hypothetical protein
MGSPSTRRNDGAGQIIAAQPHRRPVRPYIAGNFNGPKTHPNFIGNAPNQMTAPQGPGAVKAQVEIGGKQRCVWKVEPSPQ